MSVSAAERDRGRRESPMRTDHFLPRRFSSREHSPHLVADRITRYRSPSKDREGDNKSGHVTSPRIPQPYHTSFSAVTSLTSSTHKTSPLAGQAGHHVDTFPRYGLRATLPDKIRYGRSVNVNSSDTRSGSQDLLSSATKVGPAENAPVGSATPERALSCDLLDSPARPFSPISDQPLRAARSSPFDSRRLNPMYSSTPTRFHMNPKAPVLKSIENSRDKYSRHDSNVSSNTLDSVFGPESPQPQDANDRQPSAVSSDDTSCEISKPPDSGFVEGKVERKWLVEREYGTCVVLTYADLKKLKKKGTLPEPNEETAQLVQDMKEEWVQRSGAQQNASYTPRPEKGGRLGRSRFRSTLNKKAHSITDFIRRLQSPKSNSKPDKRGRRSKSAGRLEGNRVIGSASNSSLGGIYESSYEVPSTSSDQSSSALQTSTPSEPMRSSDTDLNQASEPGSVKVQVLVTNSPSESAKHDSNKQIDSTSTRRILKSIEDNVGGDNSVYRIFKEKQSPGYRRHAETLTARSQALKAVEIPLQPPNNKSGSGCKLDLDCPSGGSGGCSSFDSFHMTRITTNDTIGDCSLDVNITGNEPSTNTPGKGVADSDNASKITLYSKDQSLVSSKSRDAPHNASVSEHLPNGDASVREPKTPSYVKLSCAISGYKHFGGQQNTAVTSHVAKESGQEIVLDNNNSLVNGDTHGGKPVTLEYTPSKNAYVKNVSQRFENISNESKAVRKKKGSNVTSSSSVNERNSVNSQHNGALLTNSNLPATHSSQVRCENDAELSKALYESKTGWRGSGESNALPGSTQNPPSDYVDSENINFSQAKLAFVHDCNTTQGSSPTSNRSGLEKSVKSHKLNIPAERDVSHSSDIVLDTDLDSRANGVQDISSRDCDVTDSSVTPQQASDSISTSELPAERIQDGGLVSQNARAHSLDAGNTAQWNGGAVNGLECVPEVARLSCHSSFDSLDTPTPSKDGEYFLNAMTLEEDRMQELCAAAEGDLQSVEMPEELSGKVRAAIGKAHLLTTKKFKQFKGLCERNMTQGAEEDFQTTCQDLAGFWDMVLIQVHDVYHLFDEVDKLRQNDWKIASNKSSPLLSKPVVAKTPGAGKRPARTATPKSAKAAEAAKAREEARKKLLQAKKAGRRQRKTSENDDIEVKIVT